MKNNGPAPSIRHRGFTISGYPAGGLVHIGPAVGVGICSPACRASAALTNEDNPPRYLMAISTEPSKSLTSTNPFRLAEAIDDICDGRINNITKLRNGYLLLEERRPSQSNKLNIYLIFQSRSLSIIPWKEDNDFYSADNLKDLFHNIHPKRIISFMHAIGLINKH